MKDKINQNQPFGNAVTVAASGTQTSRAIDLNQLGASGFFSLGFIASGDGTATIGMLCGIETSNDTYTYIKPVTSSALTTEQTICTGVAKTSGVGGDGEVYFQVTNIPTCDKIKFYIAETGTSNTITFTDFTIIPQ